MSINDLTIGQAKELAALLNASTSTAVTHPFVGRYVLCRCYSAGVHAGILVSVSSNGEQVILKNSRRLWSWKAGEGVALSGVAQFGLKDGKVDSMNPEIELTGVLEKIPCSKFAEDSINGHKK